MLTNTFIYRLKWVTAGGRFSTMIMIDFTGGFLESIRVKVRFSNAATPDLKQEPYFE